MFLFLYQDFCLLDVIVRSYYLYLIELFDFYLLFLRSLLSQDNLLFWIAINRSKLGPTNHKEFLTKEGKKIIQDRKKDFEFIFLIEEPHACVNKLSDQERQERISELR